MYRITPRSRTTRRRTVAGTALLATTLGLGLVASSASASPTATPQCTITGTAGNDTLQGTPGPDVICGLGGNDVITGAGGNDVLDGGAGSDRLDGAAGSDTITGGTGNDAVTGGTGNDRLDGNVGNDTLSGGTGNDIMNGGAGADGIAAGVGSDICAPDGADRVVGACTNDAAGPTIAWVNLPSSVSAGTSFTATFSLKDAVGVDPMSPNIKIGGAPGWITSWCGFPLLATLVSGTAADGVWSVTCSVPTSAVTGTYGLFAAAQDRFGNSSWLDPSATGAGSFDVVGGNADNQAPTISAVTVPATVVPGSQLTFGWKATDTTGVAYAVVWVYGPTGAVDASGKPVVDYGTTGGVRTSGSATDGTWSQTVGVPTTAVAGTYSVWISTADTLGNKSYEQYTTFTVG